MQNNTQANKIDYSIRILRVISTIFILLCHIGTAINISFISQTFNVGVYIFLFISGYLYSKKQIESPKKWLINRYLKITVPCLIYVIMCLFINLILRNEYSYFSLFFYIFNLQGIFKLFEFIPSITLIPGTEHLWFITALFTCYALMLVFKRVEKNNTKLFNVFIIILFIIFIPFTYFGVRIDYIAIYFIGYILCKKNDIYNNKNLILSFFIMLVTIIFRLILKDYCDEKGDIRLYTNFMIPFTYICMTLFIVLFIKRIDIWLDGKKIHKLLENKFFLYLEQISLYIYIVHYILLIDNVSIFNRNYNVVLEIFIFVLLSIILSIILKYLCFFANKLFVKINLNKES